MTGYIQRYFGKKVYLPKEKMRLSKTYFSDSELACRSTGVVKLDHEFDVMLTRLRIKFNKPMTVNSCCRSAKHNKAVGGHPRSLHVYDTPVHKTGGTCAIDIKRRDDKYNDELVSLAWRLGFSVGINPAFIHLDTRTASAGLAQAMFSYGNTDAADLAEFKKLVGAK